MTEFGKTLWLVIQEKGPYSRSAFARLLGQRTGWEPSRQAMSNWLKGEREAPRELVPATVAALGLEEETARRLEHLYFYGQPGLPAKILDLLKEGADPPALPGGAKSEEHLDVLLDHEDELRARRPAEGEKDGPGGKPT